MTKEDVREASTRVATRAKFGGFGKLWDMLLPEIEAEITGETARKATQKFEINSVLRALVLPELIPKMVELSYAVKGTSLDSLSNGAFVRITCDNIALTPLPTYASYMRQLAVQNAHWDDEHGDEYSAEEALKLLDRVTMSNRAITFAMRTEGKNAPKSLSLLINSESDEISNALAACEDDQYLVASTFVLAGVDAVVFTVLEQKFVKRTLTAFIGNRPVSYFGQVAHLNVGKSEADFVGIRAAAISLS